MSQRRGRNKFLVGSIVFMLLAAVWAAVIYGFSSQDAEESASLSEEVTEVIIETFEVETEPSIIEHFVRKSAHFSEYAVFGGLVFGAFACLMCFFERNKYTALAPSVLISLAYAASDEYHQGFVSGRSPQLTDVLIDTSGALLAGILICLVMLIAPKIKRKIRKAD